METQSGILQVKRRAQMFRRLDKLLLEDLDKNITTTSFAADKNHT